MFRILLNSVRVPGLRLACPHCGGQMKVVAFITEHAVVEASGRSIKLTSVAEKPPPPRITYQEVLMAAGRSLIVSSSSARWSLARALVGKRYSARAEVFLNMASSTGRL